VRSMQRLATALNVPLIRALVMLWAVSGVVLVAGVVMLLIGAAPLLGLVLFIVGAVGTMFVAISLLRARANTPKRTT